MLGSGEARYETFFAELAQAWPGRVHFHRGYSEELSHWIEAASDIFLMPSQYEPCGLNQMYSLRYGTVPVVRRTGGLADSVQPYDPASRQARGWCSTTSTWAASPGASPRPSASIDRRRTGAGWCRMRWRRTSPGAARSESTSRSTIAWWGPDERGWNAVLHHDDLAIVRALGAGDSRRFDEFFDEIFPRLYRFVLTRTRGDTELAREVCQQTLVRTIENLGRYRGEAALFTWICQIARNALFDLAERAERDRTTVLAYDEDDDVRSVVESIRAPSQHEPEQRGANAQLAQLVVTALDTLPVHYSRVLEWKYVEGLSVQDMSKRLGHPFQATQSLLWRAREFP